MSVTIPPADTAARKAMTDQGNELYPGVDQWHHPEKGLPAGKLLVQFDYRDADVIKQSTSTASVYFTDADTLMKYMTAKDEVQARPLAEALQVGPYRPDVDSPHLYSQNVTIYKLQRELMPEQVQVAQRAEFGEGLTRNNLHWGEGVGKQFFIDIPKDQMLTGANPLLTVAAVMPCIDREHRLDWMKQLELTKQPDQAVKEAVARVYESKVTALMLGSPDQQQRGQEITELLKERRAFDAPSLGLPAAKKLPSLDDDPKPGKSKRRGHHF